MYSFNIPKKLSLKKDIENIYMKLGTTKALRLRIKTLTLKHCVSDILNIMPNNLGVFPGSWLLAS